MNNLGSTRAVINSNHTVLETRDYYPYGLEMPGRSFVSGTKAKENFTGHELDAESGLIYTGARFYMPNIGRWASVDPVADKYPGWSPYNYVLNNPLGLVDPDGRAPICPSCDIRQNHQIFERTGVRQAAPNSTMAKAAGEIALGFTPAGIALDVRDMSVAISNRDALGGALAGIGFLGGAGDAFKKGGQFLRRSLRRSDANILGFLEDGGRLGELGTAGRGRGTRNVTGDESDAKSLFDYLRGDNEIVDKGNGTFVAKSKTGEGHITFRTSSKSGPPTVDVHGVEEGVRKIKFMEP